MAALADIDKAQLRERLLAHVRDELEAVTQSHRSTTRGATHEESRPENDKDTRALESTYLARGLAMRVAQLTEDLARLERFAVRAFSHEQPLALAALVRIDDEGTERVYFLAPAGAGTKLEHDGLSIIVLTPSSPLGRMLIGKHLDDEVQFDSPQGQRHLVVLDLA